MCFQRRLNFPERCLVLGLLPTAFSRRRVLGRVGRQAGSPFWTCSGLHRRLGPASPLINRHGITVAPYLGAIPRQHRLFGPIKTCQHCRHIAARLAQQPIPQSADGMGTPRQSGRGQPGPQLGRQTVIAVHRRVRLRPFRDVLRLRVMVATDPLARSPRPRRSPPAAAPHRCPRSAASGEEGRSAPPASVCRAEAPRCLS